MQKNNDQHYSSFELYVKRMCDDMTKQISSQIAIPTFSNENQMLRLIFEYVVKQTQRQLLSKKKLRAIFSIVNSKQYIISDFTDDYLHLMYLLVGKSSLVDHEQIQTIIQALLAKITKGKYQKQLNFKQKQQIINKWASPNKENLKNCVLQQPHQSQLFRNVVYEIIMKSTSQSTTMTLMLISFAIIRVGHSVEFYNIFFSSGIKNQKDYQLVRSCMPGKIGKAQENSLQTKKIDMKEQQLINFMLQKIVKHCNGKLSQSFIIFTIIEMSKNYSAKNIPILKQFLSSNYNLTALQQTEDTINEIRQRYFQALVEIIIKPQYNKDQLHELAENLLEKLVRQKFTILMLKSTIKKIQKNYNKKNIIFKTDLKQIFHIFMIFRNYYSESKSFLYFTTNLAYLIRKFPDKWEQATLKMVVGINKIKKFGRFALFTLYSSAKNSPVYYFSIEKKPEEVAKIFIEIVQEKKHLIQSNTEIIISEQIIDIVCQFYQGKMKIEIGSQKKQHVNLQTQSQISFIRIGAFAKCEIQTLIQRQTCLASLRQLQFIKNTMQNQKYEHSQLIMSEQSNFDILLYPKQQKSSKLNFLHLFEKNQPLQSNVKVSLQKSFFQYFRELGGTDLIFLLTSHLLSSLQDNDSDEQYLVSILNSVLQIDGAYQQHYPISTKNKQKRMDYIVYLCWWAVTNFRSRKVILALLGFIKVLNPKKSIRKEQFKITDEQPAEENKNCIYLNVLCNFSIWRKMSVEDQREMLQSCKPLLYQLIKHPKSIYYCKCILIELIATYKIPIKKQINQGKSQSQQLEQQVCYHQQDQQYLTAVLKLAAEGSCLVSKVISEYLVNKQQTQLQCPKLQVYKQFFDVILFIIQILSSYTKKHSEFLKGQRQKQIKLNTKFEYAAIYTTSQLLLTICSNLDKKLHLRDIIQSLKKSPGLNGQFFETICTIFIELEKIIQITAQYQCISQTKLNKSEILEQFRISDGSTLKIYNQRQSILQSIKSSEICKNLIKSFFKMSTTFGFNSLMNYFMREVILNETNISSQRVSSMIKQIIVELEGQIGNVLSSFEKTKFANRVNNAILHQKINEISNIFSKDMQQINLSDIHFSQQSKQHQLIKKLYYYLLKNYTSIAKFEIDFLDETIQINQRIYEELMKIVQLSQIKQTHDFQCCVMLVNLSLCLLYVFKMSEIQAEEFVVEGTQNELSLLINQKRQILHQNFKKIKNFDIQEVRVELTMLTSEILNHKYKKMSKTDILEISNKIYNLIMNYLKSTEQVSVKTQKVLCPVEDFLLNKNNKLSVVSKIKEFFLQRSNFLTKASKKWMELQQHNQYFWKLFTQSHSYYRLDPFTNNFKQKIFLTLEHEKPALILPQIKNAQFSNQDDAKTSSTSTINQPKTISYYQQFQGLGNSKIDTQQVLKKNKKVNKLDKSLIQKVNFFVLILTQDRVYQGDVYAKDTKLIFSQRQEINTNVYRKFLINPIMQRKTSSILEERIKIQIPISKIKSIMFKKYLQNPIALELQTASQCIFFIFSSFQSRQNFIEIMKNSSEDITKMLMLQRQQLHKFCYKWKTGLISNFKYLMILNDYSGRSMIDISQYYVFPWTITNFTDNLDSFLLADEKNLRKLNLPVGRINEERWEIIKKRYADTLQHQEQSGHKAFLYGSFYSNPAIVSGYLIRLFPFSQYQYLLQNSKFDHADRLFHGIQQLYKSCTTNISDVKELIPQFYSNSEFLFNRNVYDFGGRQCGNKVDDVKLPNWVKTQRPQEFIFKMRRALQCHYTKSHLNEWIDLVFGIYNKRQNALSKSNLFSENIYQEDLQHLSQQQKNFRQMFYKQFGQMPDCIFEGEHPQAQEMGLPNEAIQLPKIQKYFQKHLAQKKHSCKIIAKDDIRLIKNGKIITVYASIHKLQSEEQNDNFQLSSEKCSSFDFIQDTTDSNFNTFISFFHIEENELYLSLIGKSLITSSFKFTKTKKKFFTSKSIPVQLVRAMGSNIIISSDSNILVYSHSKNANKKRKKSGLDDLLWENTNIVIEDIVFESIGQFTQHNAIIKHIDVCSQIYLATSVDQLGRIFIWQIIDKNIKVRNFFDLQTLFCSQIIMDIRVHEMGLIIVYTSQKRILVYNYFGQLIINSKISFKKEQILTSVQIFNQQSSELLLGTSLGNIWKVDLFDLGSSIYSQVAINLEFNDVIKMALQKNQDTTIKNKKIADIQIIRYGLHWKIYAITQRGRVFTVSSPFFIKAKKQIFTQRLDTD